MTIDDLTREEIAEWIADACAFERLSAGEDEEFPDEGNDAFHEWIAHQGVNYGSPWFFLGDELLDAWEAKR